MNSIQTNPETVDIRRSKYFLYIAIVFVAILMISNTVAVKLVQIGPFVFNGAIFIFPVSYIFGDILTEVYGYRQTRKIIWAGFAALILMSFFYWIVQLLPAASFWKNQDAYMVILGSTPRIVLASMVGYFIGEFANSYVISRMKVLTNGKYLWTRFIGSTIVGQAFDTVLFSILAFAGTLSVQSLIVLIVSGYIAKSLYEIIATPITYFIVNHLKKSEGIDVFDHGVKYNPFLLKE